MSQFFKPMEEQDIDYDGFYDGQNKIVADNTELEFAVIDGFVGQDEGKCQQVCMVNISITTPGEFFGQKYNYNAKLYDLDPSKRDLAMRNLGVLDAQAGFPMTKAQLEPTTETIQNYWVGAAEARVKFGMFCDKEDGHEINFIRGFGYDRNKMRKPAVPQQAQQQAQQQAAYQQPTPTQQSQQQGQSQEDPNIDF